MLPAAQTAPLDLALIDKLLGASAVPLDLIYLPSCASTNTLLLEAAADGAGSGRVLVCGEQTAGRGRRGRAWVSAAGYSLTFSLLWRFPKGQSFAGLPLAAGLAVALGLESLGVEGLALKWPNDICLFGAKLGGILAESLNSRTDAAVVVGVGLNLMRHPDWEACLERPLAALSDAGVPLAREAVLGAVLRQLADAMTAFAREGFAPFCKGWLARNAYADLPVTVEGERMQQRGVCRGVDEQGALLLDTGGERLVRVWQGDVSLRLEEG